VRAQKCVGAADARRRHRDGPRGLGRGRAAYADADRDYAAGVVAQAAVAFENAFHQREVVERKQLERELTLAATIQKNLFPAELPLLLRCDMAATNRPARLVGGDYYDALTVDAPTPAHGACWRGRRLGQRSGRRWS
jgi:hypothetical protein